MNPIYLDLHIHTSENPEALNKSYDSDTLLSKVSETAQELDFLISLTDHNIINERAYLDVLEKIKTDYPNSALILGVELHIRKYREDENAKAYHCHIFFDIEEITSDIIQNINSKLDILYPNKIPANKDNNIPLIEDILDTFNEYDFLLLPHGGQTHSTFDDTVRSASESQDFDNTLYRSLYYNFFDGFTSRSNDGIKKTLDYFRKIGIDQFVGLVTASDNYQPNIYPNTKSKEASKFVPTWMFATPTFDGLRVALSDSTRLTYSQNKPKQWENTITHIQLSNEKIDIDINFTAGLNVIIGGSSSGKTLLVDSIDRKLNNKLFNNESVYNEKFIVEKIDISCPTGLKPYYIHQNYISEVINTHGQINEIEPLNKLFPETKDQRKQVSVVLAELKGKIEKLFNIIEDIELLEKSIKKIPVLSALITVGQTKNNPINILLQKANEVASDLIYDSTDFDNDKSSLIEIHEKLSNYPIIQHDKDAYEVLLNELKTTRNYFLIHEQIVEIIIKHKNNIDSELEKKLGKEQERKRELDDLLKKMSDYYQLLKNFDVTMLEITAFNKTYKTPHKEINGHKLFFEGNITIDSEIIKKAFNKYLLADKKIQNQDFENIKPQNLFTDFFTKTQPSNPIGAKPQYSVIANNVYNFISEQNKTKPKILTKEGEDFAKLSPGKQTAIILDLVLSYDEDSASIIIDQPEDNLSSEYMNTELVELIKKKKHEKQIVFVSHSATIPMIGDAQNIILCENNNGIITIRSAPLEGGINGRKIVDYIAEITDGGKQSVKKRFKKYNLKKYKE